MMDFREFSIKGLQLCGVSTNARGNKISNIKCENQQIRLQLGQKEEPLRCPFGASSWADLVTERLSMCYSSTPELERFFNAFDERVIELVAENSHAYLGLSLDLEAGRQMYVPIMKPGKGEYSATIRTKINANNGRYGLKCFTPDAEPREMPNEFRDCKVLPCVEFMHIWFQNKQFGVTLLTTHAMIFEEQDKCPFI
jgi:hypothetical protein